MQVDSQNNTQLSLHEKKMIADQIVDSNSRASLRSNENHHNFTRANRKMHLDLDIQIWNIMHDYYKPRAITSLSTLQCEDMHVCAHVYIKLTIQSHTRVRVGTCVCVCIPNYHMTNSFILHFSLAISGYEKFFPI